LILTFDDISSFSKCPLYREKSKKYLFPKPLRLSIVEKVIRKAYIRRTEYEKKAEWKVILSWVDREVFKDVDVSNDEALEAGRKLSESILIFIQKWYQFDYLRTDAPSYPDVPIFYDFGRVLVKGKIPLLTIGDIPLITYIDETDIDNLEVYRDIKVMAWACALIEQLEVEAVNVRYISIGERSALSEQPATIKKDKCPHVRKIVEQIAASIDAKVCYPSFTAECMTCSFRRGCRF
jgi:hypothetical protein